MSYQDQSRHYRCRPWQPLAVPRKRGQRVKGQGHAVTKNSRSHVAGEVLLFARCVCNISDAWRRHRKRLQTTNGCQWQRRRRREHSTSGLCCARRTIWTQAMPTTVSNIGRRRHRGISQYTTLQQHRAPPAEIQQVDFRGVLRRKAVS